MTKLTWTLLALAGLGATAHADEDRAAVDEGMGSAISISGSSSRRGVAQDYLVMPSGGELTGTMKFLTARPMLGDQELRFSDLALFGLAGRWSLFTKLELSAHVELLPKQPSSTDEKPWQSVGGGIRSPLGRRAALAITGAGGHLIDHEGMWTRETLTLEWRKPIAQVMTFDIAGAINGVSLSAPRAPSAFITEVSVATSALFREPTGHWGAWVGLGYAVPVTSRGKDPTTGMAVDPQPRLDFRVGTVLSLVKEWDLYVDYAIIDRGDLEDAATRLPILDGGFDQHQVTFGVTRHIEAKRSRSRYRDDGVLELGMR